MLRRGRCRLLDVYRRRTIEKSHVVQLGIYYIMSSVGASGRKKQRCRFRSLDDLPEEILERILNYIPLPDAVSTSVLAKHWRHKWESLSRLIFDCKLYESIPPREKDYPGPGTVYKYTEIVNNVLFSQTGPINELHIYIPASTYKYKLQDRINWWLKFAAGIGVKDLTLIYETSYYNRRHPVGRCNTIEICHDSIFSCVDLTHLSLSFITISSSFRGFPRLISLKLETVISAIDKVEMLISACPELRFLDIYTSYDVYCLSSTFSPISAPKLESLAIRSEFPDWIYVRVGASTNIRTVSLVGHYNPVSSYMIEFLANLRNVEKLDLSFADWNWKVPAGDKYNLSFSLSHLKTLKISGSHSCGSWEHIMLAVCLIRSSPKLQQLDIIVNSAGHHGVLDFTEDCNLENLQSVKLSCVSVSTVVLNLVKFLLACSPVLEVMLIALKNRIWRSCSD